MTAFSVQNGQNQWDMFGITHESSKNHTVFCTQFSVFSKMSSNFNREKYIETQLFENVLYIFFRDLQHLVDTLSVSDGHSYGTAYDTFQFAHLAADRFPAARQVSASNVFKCIERVTQPRVRARQLRAFPDGLVRQDAPHGGVRHGHLAGAAPFDELIRLLLVPAFAVDRHGPAAEQGIFARDRTVADFAGDLVLSAVPEARDMFGKDHHHGCVAAGKQLLFLVPPAVQRVRLGIFEAFNVVFERLAEPVGRRVQPVAVGAPSGHAPDPRQQLAGRAGKSRWYPPHGQAGSEGSAPLRR